VSKLTDNDLTWLLSFESGRAFYNAKMKNSTVTQKTYTRWLKVYCDDLGLNPDQLALLKPNMADVMNAFQNKEKIPDPNQADKTLEDYLGFRMNEFYLKNPYSKKKNPKGHPQATTANKFNVMITIRSFYSANLRDLAKQTGKSLEKLKSKQRTPDVDDCVKLEKAMGNNARNAFLLWFLESCPVRVGTLKKLTWKDLKPLDDKDVPYWISIDADRLKGSGKGRYSKAKHVGFLHKYTGEKLKDYKKELKEKGIIYDENSPLFMSYHINQHGAEKGTRMVNFNDAFSNASIVAFGDDENKYYSPHDFRDLLSSVLGKPQINAKDKNIAKALVSHSATGIEGSYENFDGKEDKPNEDLLALFKQCIPFLLPETPATLKMELEQQKTQNNNVLEEMRKRIEDMQQQYENRFESFKNSIIRDQQKVNESLNKFVNVTPNKEEILAQ